MGNSDLPPTAFFIGLVLVALVILLLRSLSIVPAGFVDVRELFGRYYCTLQPGIQLAHPLSTSRALPWVSRSPRTSDESDDQATRRAQMNQSASSNSMVPTLPLRLDLPAARAHAKDGAIVTLDAVASVLVADPRKVIYSCHGAATQQALEDLMLQTINTIIGTKSSAEFATSSPASMSAEVKEALAKSALTLGYTVETVNIEALRLPDVVAHEHARALAQIRAAQSQLEMLKLENEIAQARLQRECEAVRALLAAGAPPAYLAARALATTSGDIDRVTSNVTKANYLARTIDDEKSEYVRI
jgi:regulator of protease activity HflC (stomatin/prohibitin superfamily)